MIKKIKIIPLLASLSLPFLAGSIGSYFTFPAINSWYKTLEKPFFSPPNWVFGPVWTLLYIFMGISLYLIYTRDTKDIAKSKGLKVFLIQLALNSLWSIAFFGLKSPLTALGIILVLWVLILLTIKYFMKINKAAGWLLIPYLAWVSFATILNSSIVVLNP